MARHLVVANQTANSPEFLERLKEVTREGDSIVLLVPATPAHYLLTWHERGKHDAQEVANGAKSRLRASGLQLEDAIVGDADPMRAIATELESSSKQYDRIVISTLPQGISRWLRQGLPRQVERRFDVPVTHMVVHRTPKMAGVPAGASASDPGESAATSDGWALRTLGEWRGRPVITSDGHRFSHVSEVLYDPLTTRPVWLGAIDGNIGVSAKLIPVAACVAEGDHLRVGYTWDFLSEEPAAFVGEGFSSITDEAALYDYFGLPFDSGSDLRVLRHGQAYPDSLAYPSAA
jgi:hypothetical protein